MKTKNCIKCGISLPDGANYCHVCGKKQRASPRRRTKRGNGTGSVVKLPNGKYRAVVTLGHYTDPSGVRRLRRRSKVFDTRKAAVNAIPGLLSEPEDGGSRHPTFTELYDLWLPTHRAGNDTMNCYKAAYKYFAAVHHMRVEDIDIDDLQDCLDDCPRGKSTRRNMKTLCGLVYKFGIPRHVIPENLDLSQFLIVTGEGAAHRSSFDDIQIEQIRKAAAADEGAEAALCMIYTGFRPSEFLALTGADYDSARSCLTGGAKTDAGTNRTVTVSPKIKPLIERRAASGGPLFPDLRGRVWPLKAFTEKVFYPALESAGIDNPIVEIAGGVKRHKYTPHSCRHTFATLMKRVQGAEKDKLELIGHASGEMLRYYQDVDVSDLRRITDAI